MEAGLFHLRNSAGNGLTFVSIVFIIKKINKSYFLLNDEKSIVILYFSEFNTYRFLWMIIITIFIHIQRLLKSFLSAEVIYGVLKISEDHKKT